MGASHFPSLKYFFRLLCLKTERLTLHLLLRLMFKHFKVSPNNFGLPQYLHYRAVRKKSVRRNRKIRVKKIYEVVVYNRTLYTQKEKRIKSEECSCKCNWKHRRAVAEHCSC